MLKTAARILLLRVLPRRLLPVVTVVEALMLLRSVRRRATRTRVNEPSTSRTGRPSRRARSAAPPTSAEAPPEATP